jgi:hypothetical protein
MKRILDCPNCLESKLDGVLDGRLMRRLKQRCGYKAVFETPIAIKDCDREDVCSNLDSDVDYNDEERNSDQDYASDEIEDERSEYRAGIVTSRSNGDSVPRWRMKKFTYITFNDQGIPMPDFSGCAPWLRDMLVVYYQVVQF